MHMPDPELEVDLMVCLLNDIFRALFLRFVMSKKLQWVERMRKKRYIWRGTHSGIHFPTIPKTMNGIQLIGS
ncbi:hypothetical protein ACH5RR_006690 [Cinchona calisaya]|uniref:Uncharacterized protein n=1 Tax=Cinchona calisaya TaxID=153742 RepID=A0ABD3APS6_9GENT